VATVARRLAQGQRRWTRTSGQEVPQAATGDAPPTWLPRRDLPDGGRRSGPTTRTVVEDADQPGRYRGRCC